MTVCFKTLFIRDIMFSAPQGTRETRAGLVSSLHEPFLPFSLNLADSSGARAGLVEDSSGAREPVRLGKRLVEGLVEDSSGTRLSSRMIFTSFSTCDSQFV